MPWWKVVRALAPAVLFWAALVAWLAYLLSERTDLGPEADEASVHEWIDEARSFRKTLPSWSASTSPAGRPGDDPTTRTSGPRREEIYQQLRAMVDPVRLYQGQLPVFPEMYRLEVHSPAGRTSSRSPGTRRSPARGSRTGASCTALDHRSSGPDGTRSPSSGANTGCTPSTSSSGTRRQRQAVYWVGRLASSSAAAPWPWPGSTCSSAASGSASWPSSRPRRPASTPRC